MSSVQIARLGAAVVVGGMLAAILGAATVGDFGAEGPQLLGLAWGRVTLIDLYLTFGLVWGWIAWRERSVVRASLWLVATVTLGALALGVYALGASVRADDGRELLLGPHRREAPHR